ncbi:MAG TPA: adenosylcobinamide-phosphate synthase CbiB [Acidimicrobiales bacterium]|nr:adenosylcobinamide-phosphate synthase CbiB [Acidimicrobiales bacterium]
MRAPRPLAAASGLVLDRLFGELDNAWHPVVHFGRAMDAFERRYYKDERSPGVLHAATGTLLGIVVGTLTRSTAWATGLAVGGRSLWHAADDVASALSRGDLDGARALLPTLVGRDPSDLDEEEIARAVVESVAENTVDAIVAPLLWATVAGAPGALGYRAVNTMDAMVGHHSERYEHYGWASARLDDVANWLPARVAAVLVAMVRPDTAKDVRFAVSTQSSAHPSPNAGVVEAAFAGALGVRLGGRNRYGDRVEDRPTLGSGRPVGVDDIHEAVRLSRDVVTSLAVILGAIGLIQWWHKR